MFPVILVLRADKAETNKQKKKTKQKTKARLKYLLKQNVFYKYFITLPFAYVAILFGCVNLWERSP